MFWKNGEILVGGIFGPPRGAFILQMRKDGRVLRKGRSRQRDDENRTGAERAKVCMHGAMLDLGVDSRVKLQLSWRHGSPSDDWQSRRGCWRQRRHDPLDGHARANAGNVADLGSQAGRDAREPAGTPARDAERFHRRKDGPSESTRLWTAPSRVTSRA